MSMDTNDPGLPSLRRKYEQVCRDQSIANTRNLSVREDLARMKQKFTAFSSCEEITQNLKNLKV